MITQDRLRELFNYNPQTGELFALKARNRWGRTPPGLIPCPRLYHKDGRPKYAQIEIDGKHYYLHRIIWMWMTGLYPDEVDHNNRDICCNVWSNLRDANRSNNSCNRTKQSNNTSGYKGVYFKKSRGVWCAKVTYQKQVYNLGTFITPELAHEAYKKKAAELHKEFYCD